MMKNTVVSGRTILRGCDAGEVAEVPAHVRLVRIARQSSGGGQIGFGISRQLLEHRRKPLYAREVLGCQPDGRMEQGDEMPGAVTRFPLYVRDAAEQSSAV
jgi:hypothetical protein